MFDLAAALHEYEPTDPVERSHVERARQLISVSGAFNRSNLERHFTASGFVMNPDGTQLLMVRHAKIGRWLQPGGHCDGETDVLDVAVKEVVEETGAAGLQLAAEGIFDVDIHAIAEHKGVPAHDHYDIGFLFVADDQAPLRLSEESTAVQWRSLSAVASEDPRIARVLHKLEQLRPSLGVGPK